MARNLALWSMTLMPGDKYPIYITNDFVITNAALSDELADEAGRSVVKVTYHPINPALLGDASDSELDSEDFDDEDLEGLEDEFELDEDEGFKEVAKKSKANGKAAGPNDASEGDEDEEDEEEEDEDEEDDDDFSDGEPEVTNVICSLTAGKTEQAQLNLTFTEGDAVMFEVTGKNAVHLMGNYIRQPEEYDSSDDEEDSEFDSEDDYDELYGDDDEDMEEAPVGKITEIPAVAKKAAVAAPVADKKRKADAVEASPASKAAAAASAPVEQLSKKQKKLAAAAEANDAAKAAAKKDKEPKKEQQASKKRTLPSGLVIEDVKQGEGAGAKRGKRLGMRYIGKLTNGKQFDANTAGKPFSFVLGRGEVIKGWDEGLEGMKVGGERKLSIPPQLAYGNQKLPGIPKGSTLNFEVKLVSIN